MDLALIIHELEDIAYHCCSNWELTAPTTTVSYVCQYEDWSQRTTGQILTPISKLEI